MTETAKERIYREALEKTRDRLDSFEELYANKEVYYAFDELLGLVEKGLKQGSKIPVTTDKLSVEKLQEQLNTAKKALTEIADVKRRLEQTDDFGVGFQPPINALAFVIVESEKALAALEGGEDEL